MRKIKREWFEGEYFKYLEQFLWYETVWSIAVEIQVMAKPCAFPPCSQKKVPRSRELGNPPRVYNPLLVGSLASKTNVNQFKWKARLKLYGWIVQEVPWRKPLLPFAVDLCEFLIFTECLLNLVPSAAHCGGIAWTDYLEQRYEPCVLRDLFILSCFDHGAVLATFWAIFSHCLRCYLGSVLFEGRIPCAGAYP